MQALSEKIMNLEVGTMVHFELSKRKSKLSKNYLNKINQQFLDIGHMPIPCCKKLEGQFLNFQTSTISQINGLCLHNIEGWIYRI